ncbi:MAG: hypothetical protein WC449_05200 [Candidatus Paceibacterota bacterium]
MKRNYELYYKIKELLETRKYNQTEISIMLNTTRNLVKTVARENGLCLGRGPVKYWEYTGMSEPLAYIIGAYLTDGSISNNSFSISVKDIEFRDRVKRCFDECNINATTKNLPDDFFGAFYNSIMFCSWVKNSCDGKNSIPKEIFNSSTECKASFISALIDGDGTVRQKGVIRVCGTFGYILELPELLNIMNMHGTISVQKEFTINKKNYYTVYIRPKEFISIGGKCAIPRKQNRIDGMDYYVCPVCGQKRKHTKEAKTCQECYWHH